MKKIIIIWLIEITMTLYTIRCILNVYIYAVSVYLDRPTAYLFEFG